MLFMLQCSGGSAGHISCLSHVQSDTFQRGKLLTVWLRPVKLYKIPCRITCRLWHVARQRAKFCRRRSALGANGSTRHCWFSK
jgi:hypothetical protein